MGFWESTKVLFRRFKKAEMQATGGLEFLLFMSGGKIIRDFLKIDQG